MDIRRFFSRGGSSAQSDEREKQETDRAEGAGVMEVSGLQVLKETSGVFKKISTVVEIYRHLLSGLGYFKV